MALSLIPFFENSRDGNGNLNALSTVNKRRTALLLVFILLKSISGDKYHCL